MTSVSVDLSPNQKKKLQQAVQMGTDFKTKLSNSQLDGLVDLIVGKVMSNKMLRAKVAGKGCMLTMTSAQVKKSGKGLQIEGGVRGNGLQVEGGLLPTVAVAVSTLSQVGTLIQGMDKFLKDRGVYDALTPAINSTINELNFIISNPEYRRYKNIYVNRIPRLIRAHGKVKNKMTFIKRKPTNPTPKMRANRLNRLQLRADNIVETIKMLFMQLPRLAEYVEARNSRQAGALASNLENTADSVETAASAEAEWDEEDGGPTGGAVLLPALGAIAAVDALSRPIAKVASRGQKNPKKKATSDRVADMGLLGLLPTKKGKGVTTPMTKPAGRRARAVQGSGASSMKSFSEGLQGVESLINPRMLSLDPGLSMTPTIESMTGRGMGRPKKKNY